MTVCPYVRVTVKTRVDVGESVKAGDDLAILGPEHDETPRSLLHGVHPNSLRTPPGVRLENYRLRRSASTGMVRMPAVFSAYSAKPG